MQFIESKDYPRCEVYLYNILSFGNLKKNWPKVWAGFRQVSESDALAEEALTPRKGPLVRIATLKGVCGVYEGRSGGMKHKVFVDTKVAKAYENCFQWKGWEATVLHELIHWARFIGGKPSLYGGQEAGEAFEKLAYGGVQPCRACKSS